MDTGPRRLLATMPLHAITATYGEPGLRERFAAEIAGFGDADRHRLEDALELAARLHRATGGRTSRTSTTRCGWRSGSCPITASATRT